MNRRTFLSSSTGTLLAGDDTVAAPSVAGISEFANKTIPRLARTTAALDPIPSPPTRDQIAHLLRRTMFGPRRAEIDSLVGQTIDQIVETLLADTAAPDPPLNTSTSDTMVPVGQTWVNAAKLNADGTNPFSTRVSEFKSWWTGLMLNQGISITEKMTLFWHNHFVSESNVVADARFTWKQNALYRQNACGNWRTLAKLATIDPGMLRYLNGNTNTNGSPNENYGRELQELFTIGKGPEIAPGNYTNYTEADVQAAAKVLTGWRDDGTGITSYFTLSRHDTTNKQFSSAYGNTVIAGSTDPNGNTEIDALLDMIFAQTETAKFLCRKLYRWFVYYIIDDAAEANVIAPLADILRTGGYEVKPVLRALLKSQHFFDPVNVGCVIKNPVEHTVGLCRQMGVAFPDALNLAGQYNQWKYIRTAAANMQLDLGDPPNVAGWAAYYQTPQFYEIWINSDTLPKRNQFSDTLNTTGHTQNSFKIVVDPIAYVNQVSNPADPNVIVDEFARELFPIVITANQHQFLRDTLLPGLPDYEWTNEWNTYLSNPSDPASQAAITSKLRSLLTFMMDMAEYQLT